MRTAAMKQKKQESPFLKKSSGVKPPTRKEIKHGLGRGLNSLIPPAVPAAAPVAARPVALAPVVDPDNAVLYVKPMDIARSPFQTRTDFDEAKLNELADSIRANGLIEPIVCRRLEDGKLELIAGERRLRACIIAGLSKVPVTIKKATDRQAAEMNLTENLQRDDLNPIDAAEGYRKLMDRFSLTQEQVAERVGKSRPAVANAVRLLELPDDVRGLIASNKLTEGHAKVLLSLDEQKDRVVFARDCVTEGLSVRALEQRVARHLKPVPERKGPMPDLDAAYVRTLSDAIRKTIGCAVRLTPGATHANGKHTKGLLEIDFVDNDDLDRLITVLGVKVE